MKGRHGLTLFFIGIWYALATAFAESTIILTQKYVLGQPIFMSLQTVWIAPIAYTLMYAGPALLLGAAGALAPKYIKPPIAFFLFGTTAAVSLLLSFEQINRFAIAVLALGFGIRSAQLLGRRTEAVLRFMRRTVVPLVGAALFIGLWMTAGAAWRERRAIASLPDAHAGAPNILFVVMDAVRPTNLGAYGYGRDTSPNIDRLASQGAVFDWFVTTSPWSLPSHSTFFTGTYPHEQSGGFKRGLDGALPTVAEILAAAGYATAGFSANLNYASRDVGLSRGFIHYEDYVGIGDGFLRNSWLGQMEVVQDIAAVRSFGDALAIVKDQNFSVPYRRASHQKSAEDMTRAMLDWLPSAGDHPFFAFINYFDAHFPYDAHEGFGDWVGDGEEPMDRYDSEIRYIDYHLGELLRELDRRGVLDETVVIVTSDHGEHFGEHDLTNHGNSLYTALLRIPLIIRFPSRVPPGVRLSTATSSRHLARTMLDFAGVPSDSLPGRSLLEMVDDPTTAPFDPYLLSEHTFEGSTISTVLDRPAELRSLMTQDLHYIRGPEGAEELYAYREDPREEHSLVASPEYEQALGAFREALLKWFTVENR